MEDFSSLNDGDTSTSEEGKVELADASPHKSLASQ